MRFVMKWFSYLVTLCLLNSTASFAQGNSEAEQHYMKGISSLAASILITEQVGTNKVQYLLRRSEIKKLRKLGFKELTKALNSGFEIDPDFKDLRDECHRIGVSPSVTESKVSIVENEYKELLERWSSWRKLVRFDFRANLNFSSIDAKGHSFAPGVGVGGALKVRLADRVSLLTEGLFTLRTSNVEADLVGSEGSPYYEITYIDIVPSVEYTLATSVMQEYRLYALGGVEVRTMLSANLKNDLNSSINSSAGISVEELDVSYDTDKLSFASNLGVGFVRTTKHVFVLAELRYAKGFETKINARDVSFNSWYLTLGVGF